MRLRTLESIIQEKIQQNLKLENDLRMAETITAQSNSNLQERQQILEQYEQRFIQVRSFIEWKDC